MEANVTLQQIAGAFHLNISNTTNTSIGIVTPAKLFDLYDAYRTKEKEQLMLYKTVAYVLGSMIMLSNLIVVISSGLILRKGQQPKSTYLLLGNVSLADTIVGASIIFGTVVDNAVNSNVLCVFQVGMIVCPTMVSIFSVGLIAIDRYIYIIHGLYYQRWINTTRVRISIIIIWMIGLVLGYVPATGWVHEELRNQRCSYITLFPDKILILNSLLSIVPILVVAILYCFILIGALKNIKNIRAINKQLQPESVFAEPKLRAYRGNFNKQNIANSRKFQSNKSIFGSTGTLTRSLSLTQISDIMVKDNFYGKSKSIEDIPQKYSSTDTADRNSTYTNDSKISIRTVETENTSDSSETASTKSPVPKCKIEKCIAKLKQKKKEPRKCRAIAVVLLTSGSFIITWLPFFIVVTFYALCENKLANPKCVNLRILIGGPMSIVAFINSTLNPLIYAWWHKGFNKAAVSYYKRFFCKNKNIFSKNIDVSASPKKSNNLFRKHISKSHDINQSNQHPI